MEFTAATIAGFLKGEIEGDPEIKVNTVAKIEEGFAGALSFLANPKYEQYIYTTKSSVVLVNKSFVPSSPIGATLIKVGNAYEAFASLLRLVDQARPRKEGIHSTAIIEDSAKIGNDEVVLTGIDRELVGTSAANIEHATHIRDRDPRVFQDGIYMVQRG